MTNYAPTKASTHQTLVAATPDQVTLPSGYPNVEVTNRDSTAVIYFTVDGTVPVSAADGTYVVMPLSALRINFPTGATVVKLISAGTPAYSVTGVYN
jgi:hypothetical protein